MTTARVRETTRQTGRIPYHDFTLDELEAYDRGVLEPERAAVVAEHLAEGCSACRRWIAASDPLARLLEDYVRAELEQPIPTTPWERARAWGRRRVHVRRGTLLLYALPLKGLLLAATFQRERRTGARLGLAVGVVGLTAAVLRAVLAPMARLDDDDADREGQTERTASTG